jgi:putative ABC transport system ATP-binding protein
MMALVLEGVSKTRGRGSRAARVLRGVSLSVAAGEFVMVEGPSGAGKTTLLAVAGGLLTPEEGRVFVGGHELHVDPRPLDRRRRARVVGFVFQRANLLPRLTVRENVLLMGAIAGLPRGDGRREADDLLEKLGLAALRDRYPHELSGGEEQRVAVARALVHRPSVVLADEPTGSLDRASGQRVAESLAELARQRETAVVVATHDMRVASFASRLVHIEDGRLEP